MEENLKTDYLARTKNGTSFVGGDIDVFRAALLAQSIKLYADTGMRPTRGVGPTAMLKLASQYTGKRYKRGAFQQAFEDLSSHIQFLKSHPNDGALPRFPTE